MLSLLLLIAGYRVDCFDVPFAFFVEVKYIGVEECFVAKLAEELLLRLFRIRLLDSFAKDARNKLFPAEK